MTASSAVVSTNSPECQWIFRISRKQWLAFRWFWTIDRTGWLHSWLHARSEHIFCIYFSRTSQTDGLYFSGRTETLVKIWNTSARDDQWAEKVNSSSEAFKLQKRIIDWKLHFYYRKVVFQNKLQQRLVSLKKYSRLIRPSWAPREMNETEDSGKKEHV